MKINSIGRMTPENSDGNYFSSTFQAKSSQANSFQQAVVQKSTSPINIFGKDTDSQSQTKRPLDSQPQQSHVRNVSPLRNRPQFDQGGANPNVFCSQNKGLRRPMSQIPSYNRGQNGFADNPLQSVINQKIIPQANQPQLLNSNADGQTFSRSNYNPIGLQSGLSREALRQTITKKGQLINDLNNNKAFFRENLEKKNNEFKEYIRAELKKSIYDKVLKTSLHYIYKHYENLKNSMNRDETLRILNTNLAKQHSEILESRKNLNLIEKNSKTLEEKLITIVNQPGIIKLQPTIVEHITKEGIEQKVAELQRENQEMEKSLHELKRWRDNQLYELKMKNEQKGRRLMEQRAIKLALQHYDPQDLEQTQLKNRIDELLQKVNLNNGTRKVNQNYILQNKKEKLEKELELLRFYSA